METMKNNGPVLAEENAGIMAFFTIVFGALCIFLQHVLEMTRIQASLIFVSIFALMCLFRCEFKRRKKRKHVHPGN